jgi:hypothetical protein
MASLAGVMAAPSLFAGIAAGNVTLVDNTSQYSYGDGGEFRAVGDAGLNNVVNWNAYTAHTSGTTSDGTDLGSWGYNSGYAVAGQKYFQTFCIEATEYFSPGSSYSASLSFNALYGHVGQSPGVAVTMGTAWLYSEFASGGLQNYGYDYTYGNGSSPGGNRTASAGALQQAIWAFQGENGLTLSGLTGQAANFVGDAETALGGLANAQAASNGKFGVMALNLGAPGAVQDQLVVAVPEPTTAVAGFGALGFVLLAIRRRSDVLKIGK